jgi:hypothetical protein
VSVKLAHLIVTALKHISAILSLKGVSYSNALSVTHGNNANKESIIGVIRLLAQTLELNVL